jgi:hypothetical protein
VFVHSNPHESVVRPKLSAIVDATCTIHLWGWARRGDHSAHSWGIRCWTTTFSSLVTLILRFAYFLLPVSICSYLLGYAEPFIYEIDPPVSPACSLFAEEYVLFFPSLFASYSLVVSSFSLRYARDRIQLVLSSLGTHFHYTTLVSNIFDG